MRDGIVRAEKYGFESERDATRFLNLMFTFGRSFDRDPTLGWATRLLARAGAKAGGGVDHGVERGQRMAGMGWGGQCGCGGIF